MKVSGRETDASRAAIKHRTVDVSHMRERKIYEIYASKYFKRGSTLDFPPHYPAGEGALMCLQLVK